MPDGPSIAETEAIVLRIHPFSRTSHLVVWLTADGQRLTTSVKGAVRPKSAFLGQYDLYQTCDVLYYTHSHDGVHIARECDCLSPREGLRTNWRAEVCASWFAHLADLASEPGLAAPSLYTLLAETLDALAALPPGAVPAPALFARYEATFLASLGLQPNFAPPSPSPNAPPPAHTRSVPFDLAEGRAVRETDATPAPQPVVRLPKTLVERYRRLVLSPVAEAAQKGEADPADDLIRFLGLFMLHHLPDAAPASRAIALRALRRETPPTTQTAPPGTRRG